MQKTIIEYLFFLFILSLSIFSQSNFKVVQRYVIPSQNQGSFTKLDFLNNDIAILSFSNENYKINSIDSSLEITTDTVPNSKDFETYDSLNMKIIKTSEDVWWATTDSVMLRTEDGGSSWDTIAEIASNSYYIFEDAFNTFYEQFTYLNNKTAFYLGMQTHYYWSIARNDGGAIYVTNDGGKNWKEYLFLELNLRDPHLISFIPYYWYPQPFYTDYDNFIEEYIYLYPDMPENEMYMSNELYTYNNSGDLIKIFNYNESNYCKSLGESGDHVYSMKFSNTKTLWVISNITDGNYLNDSIQILVLKGDLPTTNSQNDLSTNFNISTKIQYIQNRAITFTGDRGLFTLFSLQGKKIKQTEFNKNLNVDLSDISNGLYIANIKTNGKNLSKRITINR